MVSIIVPIYNVSDYIEVCLQSVLSQTYKDWELILVDDCGNDDSIILAKQMLEGYSNCIFLKHERNRGLSAARNTGMDVAQGEYVLFLDSDDRLADTCLELLVNKAEHTGVDVTIGDIAVEGQSSWIPKLNITDSPYLSTELIYEGHDDVLCAYIKGDYYVMAWNKLIRRAFLQDNNISFVEGLVHEDNPWSLSVACCASKIAIVQAETYIYTVRENSLQTSRDYKKHFDAYVSIIHYMSDIVNLVKSPKYTLLSGKSKNILINWFEKNKAIFYSQTQQNGSASQLDIMYDEIRNNCPNPAFSMARIHYLLPKIFGSKIYKKYLGYNLL